MESQEPRRAEKRAESFQDKSSKMETATERSLSISEKEKTGGILSYITIVGLIIAFVQNQEEKSEYVNFHVRQNLGIGLFGIAIWVVNVIPLLGQIIWIVGMLALFVFWVMGLMGAINGERKPVPIVGEHFQEWFKSIGA